MGRGHLPGVIRFAGFDGKKASPETGPVSGFISFVCKVPHT